MINCKRLWATQTMRRGVYNIHSLQQQSPQHWRMQFLSTTGHQNKPPLKYYFMKRMKTKPCWFGCIHILRRHSHPYRLVSARTENYKIPKHISTIRRFQQLEPSALFYMDWVHVCKKCERVGIRWKYWLDASWPPVQSLTEFLKPTISHPNWTLTQSKLLWDGMKERRVSTIAETN